MIRLDSATSPRVGFRPAAVRPASAGEELWLPDVQALRMADQEGSDETRSGEFARSCDPDEFREVFLRYGKPILSFVYSLIGDRARAEELTQETFIRAYRRLASMKAGTQLSTWLFGIARNVVREAIKEKYRDRRSIALDDEVSATLRDSRVAPDQDLFTGELNRTIRKALAGLPEDYRIVFVLKVVHHMRYEQISAITGASVGKLKTDLHRARLEMRHKLLPYLGEGIPGIRGVT
jgi:RNA polymerase sigma-70 factor (ECF subfamily)